MPSTITRISFFLCFSLFVLIHIGAAAQNTLTFTESYTSGVNPTTAQRQHWTNFKASLNAGYCYTSVHLYGSNNQTGFTISDPTYTTTIATDINQGTSFQIASGGHNWQYCADDLRIDGPAVNYCSSCNSGDCLRPLSGYAGNWGGLNGATCGAGSQTITLVFTYNSPAVNLGNDTTVCGDSLVLNAGNTGATYKWQDSSTAQQFVVRTSGIYYVQVTTSCGTARDTISVTLTHTPTQPNPISGNATVCAGGQQTYTIDSVPGATGYTWALPQGWSGNSATTSIPATVGPAGGIISVTANNTCGSSVAQTLSVNIGVTPGISGNTTGCGSVVLTASGGNTYAWNGGNNPNAASNTITSSGTYTVTVTGNTCSATISQAVTVNPLVTASITGNSTGCGAVALTANGGSTYLWSGGASPNTASNTFTANGTYTVTVTGSGGCSATTSQTVTINPVITPGITGSATGCGAVTLTATGGNSYTWSGGNNPASASDNFTSSGTYTVTVTGTGGCSATVSRTVTVYPSVTAAITGSTTGCGSVRLTATGGNTYTWSGGATPTTSANTFTNTGNYTVTVTGSGGCSATSTVLVTVNIPPTATVNPAGPIAFCIGDSVVLTANTEVGYLWSNNATLQSTTIKQSGNYTVKVTDANGCTATSAPVAVSVNTNIIPAIHITASPSDTVCAGSFITFNSSVSGQGNAPLYKWYVNGIYTGLTADSISSNQFQNNNVVICLLTSSAACANPDTAVSNAITIAVKPLVTPTIQLNTAASTICEGEMDTISTSFTNGGSVPGFIWLLNNQQITNSSANYITDSLHAADIVKCILVSNATCAIPDTITSAGINVTVNSSPNAAINPSGLVKICQGDSVQLNAVAESATFAWSTNATTQTINVHDAGNYNVTVTNANNCSAVSAPVTVVVNQLPQPPSITRSGDTLISPNGYNYQWYLNDTIIAGAINANLIVGQNGDYTVQITDNNGCSSTSAIYVITLGIDDIDSNFGVTIFPNPTSESFRLEFPDDFVRDVSLIDAAGKLIFKQQVTRRQIFDCTTLSSGMYLLKIMTERDEKVARLVITK